MRSKDPAVGGIKGWPKIAGRLLNEFMTTRMTGAIAIAGLDQATAESLVAELTVRADAAPGDAT